MNRDREGRNWSELKGRAIRQFIELDNDLVHFSNANGCDIKKAFYGADVDAAGIKTKIVKKEIVDQNESLATKRRLKDLNKMFEGKSSDNVINIMPLSKKFP